MSHASNTAPAVPSTKKAPKKMSQEKAMLILSLAFALGIVLYTFIPGDLYRGLAIGLYSVAVYYAFFKMG